VNPFAYQVKLEPVRGRLRVMFAGEAIVDTDQALAVLETCHAPVYYFPMSDVKASALSPTDHSTHCPFKGDASYWSLQVDDQVSENAVWGYPDPLPEVPELASLIAFYWDRVDSWWLDDVEIEAPVVPAD
jgi:uncharacterized protein (DUF427 family)